MPKEIYIGTLSNKVIIFEEIVIVEKKLYFSPLELKAYI